jgi:para-nitrobenzyl esterase
MHFAILISFLPFLAATQSPNVKVDCGAVEGLWEKQGDIKLASFLGIPFGAPPIGPSGRWRPARRAECWNGTLAAKKQPSACFQWHYPAIPPQGQSEDCLYLNVFAPASEF